MRTLVLSLAMLAVPAIASADEGMWTFDNFPSAKVKSAWGFAPDAKWLDHVRSAAVRLAGGCSASFVSASGLVLTNHHCVRSCVEDLSTAKQNLMADGFYARAEADERRCPGMELNRLDEIRDVTAEVRKASAGKEGQAFTDAQKAEMARLEQACATDKATRCDVVTLYNGGLFHLYRYRRYQDVRLVMAPELAAAKFGGDPDNFNFPRFGLDYAFIRAYEDGEPAPVKDFLTFSKEGATENALTFVAGHPGGTERLATISQLEMQRDHELPDALLWLSQARGLLSEFGHRGPEERRVATNELLHVENGFKALHGRFDALVDPAFFGQKVAEEKALRAWIEKEPARKKKYGGAFDAIASAQKSWLAVRKPLIQLEGLGFTSTPYSPNARGFSSDLFTWARMLVRAGDERQKPNDQRLREYAEAGLPSLAQRVTREKPINDALETAMLAFSLEKMREELGADDAVVKKVLGPKSPEELATEVVSGTRLKDPALRKKLWEGGAKALGETKDPMLELARTVDADARAIRKRYESEVESVVKKNTALLADARFERDGKSAYPDATFTLRLSYGAVKGWTEAGRTVAPFTTFAGAFERHTGRDPFALSKSMLAAKDALDLSTPFDFATTNDIIGGNSGSPVVDRDAKLVGLIFDGNLPSLGGRYGFDAATNRAVAVHSRAILETLAKVYKADRVLSELNSIPAPAQK